MVRDIISLFDFPMTSPSIFTGLYCLAFYFLLFYANYVRGFKKSLKYHVPTDVSTTAIFLIGFFMVTNCANGDFYHMMTYVHEYDYSPGAHNYGEKVYHIIGWLVGSNYLLFRIIVWGGAYLLFCLTAKRLDIKIFFVVFFLLSTYSLTFSYARATASFAIYYYGLSYLIKPLENKRLSYIIGLTIIPLSVFFHTSALLLVAVTVAILVPFRKWIVILTVIMIPVITIAMRQIFDMMLLSENTDEYLAGKLQGYSEREVERGPARYLLNTFSYLSLYVPIVFSMITIFIKNSYKNISKDLMNLYKVAFCLTIAATSFVFMGSNYVTFFVRILNMTMIPNTLIVTKLFRYKKMTPGMFHLCFLIGAGSQILRYLYNLYLTIVK